MKEEKLPPEALANQAIKLPEEKETKIAEIKARQKQALIDTMRGDEEIGLYDDNVAFTNVLK